MSFGQSAPPASAKQIEYLLALVKKAGHAGFRDARGPLALTQRQASGKFSRIEASALIDQLVGSTEAAEAADVPTADRADGPVGSRGGVRLSATEQREADQIEFLRAVPTSLLAAELIRRGWHVGEPTEPRQDGRPNGG